MDATTAIKAPLFSGSRGNSRPLYFYSPLHESHKGISEKLVRNLYKRFFWMLQRVSPFAQGSLTLPRHLKSSKPTRYVDATADRLQAEKLQGKKTETKAADATTTVPGAKAAAAKALSAFKSIARGLVSAFGPKPAAKDHQDEEEEDSLALMMRHYAYCCTGNPLVPR